VKKNSVRNLALLFLVAVAANCRRPADRSPSPTQLWKPKKGTSYVGKLPKRIIWLKDGAEMVLAPAGEFLFGNRNEKLSLDSFYIDKFPVTNQRYRKFVMATGHRVRFTDEKWAKNLNWGRKSYPKGKAKHPVVLVSFDDAVAYCKWAGKRIPTEEQWEKAARGTDGIAYPWGDEFDETKCNTLF